MLLIVGLIWLAPLAVIAWGVIDAASRPEWAFTRAGQSKTTWIVLQVAGIFFCFIGLSLSIVYLATVAPKVRRAQSGPLPPTGPGPGWYPDQTRPGGWLYWDGFHWTGDAR